MNDAFQLDQNNGRVKSARFAASPNCDPRPNDTQIDVLVIHAISLPPNCYGDDFIEALFTNTLDANAHPYFAEIHEQKVSAHFLIKRDGELLQFVPTHMRAWHAGVSNFNGRENVNDFSIGIELEGCDQDSFESAQYNVLADLTISLMTHYPAIQSDCIVAHSTISPERKTDPGPNFDWQRYRSEIE